MHETLCVIRCRPVDSEKRDRKNWLFLRRNQWIRHEQKQYTKPLPTKRDWETQEFRPHELLSRVKKNHPYSFKGKVRTHDPVMFIFVNPKSSKEKPTPHMRAENSPKYFRIVRMFTCSTVNETSGEGTIEFMKKHKTYKTEKWDARVVS